MLQLFSEVILALMLVVPNLANTQWCNKLKKMTETIAYRYSYESTQQELSSEYQHDRDWMVFENICDLVLWTKVALALEGLVLMKHVNTCNAKATFTLSTRRQRSLITT